jgi:hypothetical protein
MPWIPRGASSYGIVGPVPGISQGRDIPYKSSGGLLGYFRKVPREARSARGPTAVI